MDHSRTARLIFSLTLVALSIVVLAGKWAWYHNYALTSDLFSYSAAIGNSLRGHFMWDPTHAFVWGNHAYLVFLFFVPIYALANDAFVLISAGLFAHVLASIFVFRLAKHLFSNEWVAILLGFSYIFNPIIFEQVLMPVYGFQPDVLAAPLIFGFVYYNSLSHGRAAVVSLILLATIKEEFALLSCGLSMLCILNFIYNRICPKLALWPLKNSTKALQNSLYYLLLSALLLIISFTTLRYAKSVTSFSYAPSLTLSEIKSSLNGDALLLGASFVELASRSLCYLSFLTPELALPALLRTAINTAAYNPHDLFSLILGHAYSWSGVAAINLIFLGSIISIFRLNSLTCGVFSERVRSMATSVLLALCVGLSVSCLVSPRLLGFKSSLLTLRTDVSSDAFWIRGKEYAKSLRSVEPLLPQRRSDNEILIISPPFFKEFQGQNAVVFRFAKNMNPSLLAQTYAAVLLKADQAATSYFESNPSYKIVYSDDIVVLFILRNLNEQ